jgi:small conductance mechanosensitive channel
MPNLQGLESIAEEYFNKFIDFLPQLIGTILVLLIGWWIVNIILKQLRKIFEKRDFDQALKNFLLAVTGVILKILVIITAASQLGIEMTSFIAILGAAGLAIGLALQGSLANFAGGVLIILLKPFRIGDWIEAQGVSGSVKEISIFYTKINTFGNQLAVIPNGDLSNNNVINYTVEGTRKDALTFRVGYDNNIKEAKDILMKLMEEQEGIFEDPAPQVVVHTLADNCVNLSARFWATNDDFWGCHWYTIEEAKARLEAAGMNIPFPQRDVHFFDESKKD